jgi:plasmid stabilization system protein ParE
MCSFIVAPEAEDDVYQIWRYLFREAGAETANRIENEILEAFADLAGTPAKGHRRSDLTKRKVLFYTLYQYLVVYRVGQSSRNCRGAAWQARSEADSESAVVKQEARRTVVRGREVEQAIAIVIECSQPALHGFDLVFGGCGAVVEHHVDSRERRQVLEADGGRPGNGLEQPVEQSGKRQQRCASDCMAQEAAAHSSSPGGISCGIAPP